MDWGQAWTQSQNVGQEACPLCHSALCVTLPKSQRGGDSDQLPWGPVSALWLGQAGGPGSQSNCWNAVLLSCLFLSPPLAPLDHMLREDKGQVSICSACARHDLVR